MAKDMFWTTVTFGIIIGVLALAFWPVDRNVVTVKYYCNQLVNDAPISVQEECRKRRQK